MRPDRLSPSEVKRKVELIKADLRAIGWTLANPDDMGHMNHGPIHTRLEAEELYTAWRKLVNPYGL